MVSIKSLNRAAVLDGVAIAAQAAMARTNMDLFIASPLELARSRRVMIGGLATLTECLLVLHARPEVACRYWAGRVALRNCARQHRRAGPRRSEVAENKSLES